MAICIDIETTGFGQSDEIVQFAMFSNGGNKFSELYRPINSESWEEAEKIHGISPLKVKGKFPFNHFENISFIQNMIDNAELIIGYNHECFDIPFLEKYGFNFSRAKTYDVMKNFAKYYNEKCNGEKARYKLKFAADHFGYTFTPHDATEDVKVTYYIYEQLKKAGY